MTATRECKHTFEVGSVNVTLTTMGELPDNIEQILDLVMAHIMRDRVAKIGISMSDLRIEDQALTHDEMVTRDGSFEIGQFRASCEATCHLGFELNGIAAKQRAEAILAPIVTHALAFIAAAFDDHTSNNFNEAMTGLARQRFHSTVADAGYDPERIADMPGVTLVDVRRRDFAGVGGNGHSPMG